jgi:hypothetical protein
MTQTKPQQPTAVIGLVGERTWTLGYQGDRRRGDSGYGVDYRSGVRVKAALTRAYDDQTKMLMGSHLSSVSQISPTTLPTGKVPSMVSIIT